MHKKSNSKSFGILFGIVFLIIAIWPIINSDPIRYWALVFSIIFFTLGFMNSKLLEPLNKYWIKLGEFLGKVIAPVVMLLIYFLIVTPISLLLKIFNKDILNLKLNKKKTSYWIEKKQKLGSMKNQF